MTFDSPQKLLDTMEETLAQKVREWRNADRLNMRRLHARDKTLHFTNNGGSLVIVLCNSSEHHATDCLQGEHLAR